MTQTTPFKKYPVRSGFKGLEPRVVMGLWIVLLIIGLFLFSNEVLGAIPLFEDDFETYTTGEDLGAQTDWTCNHGAGYQPTISEDRAYSGIKSVKNKYADSVTESFCYRGEEVIATGGQQIWFYLASGISGNVTFYPHEYIQLRYNATDDTIEYYDENQAWQTLAIFDEWNEWVVFATEWKLVGENTEYRYSYNEGNWTDWQAPEVLLNPYRIKIYWKTKDPTGSIYFDTIEELPAVCEIGTCYACLWYGSCEEAGCFWWYSIYQPGGLWSGKTGGWCIEAYEPDPEECGPLWKCQYCMTQETCEAEYCEWADRYGTGEKCYTQRPTIPPEQVAWEVPDLEECGALSGVELWLCEIKNFGAGIFMPSQAKINDLYYTIGAFKDRFPFSYAEALNRFFTEIETSLDEEKGIPITILGNESEVSFAFWDKTTTIGGEEETFKNIWFDFTSVIVILGWFVWLISLIKRFFK